MCVGARVCISLVLCLYFDSSVNNFLLRKSQVASLSIFTEEIHMVRMGVKCLFLPLRGNIALQ